MKEHLTVELGDRSYPIIIEGDLQSKIRETLNRLALNGRKSAVITEERVFAAQKDFIDATFGDIPRLVLPAGETTKSLTHLGRIYDFLAAEKIDRRACLFAFGGGVIGDLTGFAAASYLRGIDFYQVPTSLLAMVDSSVGGKTGINISAGKNLVGAFWQPQTVFIDTKVLRTLPPRDFGAGMAEVIKHGMLADISLFERLESAGKLHPDHPQLASIIRRNCEIKAGVVKADEEERAASGGRALLNLGHTFGHAVEAVTSYGEYEHGEAIGLGLLLSARLSMNLGYLSSAEVDRVKDLLKTYNLPVVLKESLPLQKIMDAMHRDKKVKQGKIRFVVMEALGKAITIEETNLDLVRQLWREVGAEG